MNIDHDLWYVWWQMSVSLAGKVVKDALIRLKMGYDSILGTKQYILFDKTLARKAKFEDEKPFTRRFF